MRVPVESSLGTEKDHTFIVIVINSLINLKIQCVRGLAIMDSYGHDLYRIDMKSFLFLIESYLSLKLDCFIPGYLALIMCLLRDGYWA